MMLTLRTLLTTSVATLALCGPTIAQEAPSKSIFTSGEKGAYHTLFCPPLPAALSNAYFQGYRCTLSRGTLENIDRVLKEPTNIGFVQLDVFAAEAAKRRDEFKKLTVIRSDIACEGHRRRRLRERCLCDTAEAQEREDHLFHLFLRAGLKGV